MENVPDLKEFDIIWRNYACMLPINEYDFDNYMKIINKIRYYGYDFCCIQQKEKKLFLDLIDCISITIHNNYEYDKKNDELIFCNKIKIYLQDL